MVVSALEYNSAGEKRSRCVSIICLIVIQELTIPSKVVDVLS